MEPPLQRTESSSESHGLSGGTRRACTADDAIDCRVGGVSRMQMPATTTAPASSQRQKPCWQVEPPVHSVSTPATWGSGDVDNQPHGRPAVADWVATAPSTDTLVSTGAARTHSPFLTTCVESGHAQNPSRQMEPPRHVCMAAHD